MYVCRYFISENLIEKPCKYVHINCKLLNYAILCISKSSSTSKLIMSGFEAIVISSLTLSLLLSIFSTILIFFGVTILVFFKIHLLVFVCNVFFILPFLCIGLGMLILLNCIFGIFVTLAQKPNQINANAVFHGILLIASVYALVLAYETRSLILAG